jgi:putative transposase
VRFTGRILSVVVSRRADQWYASFSIEIEHTPPIRTDTTVVGVDLGITALATLSDDPVPVVAPKPLRRYLKKLKRLSRALSRKVRGSCNRAKAKTKLARLHLRMANIRLDALHKLTISLVRRRTIVIEDLNVSGMLSNRSLARAIADLGFYEFRRQLEYKAQMFGSTVLVANRWYPSSKLCSNCGAKNDELGLCDRRWECASCGTAHERDRNAASNLARYAGSSPASACGAEGSGRRSDPAAKPAA